MQIQKSLLKLISYVEKETFSGYDPYDTLNSPVLRNIPGSLIPAVFIQIQKRNPVNIRSFLGIKKGINPKAMGLFLKSYCLLYREYKDLQYLEKAAFIFEWLKNNYSKGYAGYAWGYNFAWASPGSYLKSYTPSVVVTSFVVDGIFEYFKITNNNEAKQLILSAADYIKKDIPITHFDEGISFSYTHLSKGACYNASLLAAEILAKANWVEKTDSHNKLIEKAISFVLSKQKQDGSWLYSINPETSKERKQIDFHQGFILVSLDNLTNLTGILTDEVNSSLERGLHFYHKKQFFPDGRCLWRRPKQWPLEIHNQAQGVITFSKLSKIDDSYSDFASVIARWTIKYMQDKEGFFYYRKHRFFTNKIPFMRWSQAWMMLALTQLLDEYEN